MQTRRQLLQQSLMIMLPLRSGRLPTPCGLEILRGPGLLSQESARGFAMITPLQAPVVVICGANAQHRDLTPYLLKRAEQGARIIWEHCPGQQLQVDLVRSVLRSAFGISIGEPFRPSMYVEYIWPERRSTRSFLQATAVDCSSAELIARHGSTPIAMRRSIGMGQIIFLGSMLGPHLYAEDPQAHQIANALTGM